ncbi:MAG: PilZ domain-containing protein [Acidobacteriota bacterium]|nr:PilZ domain-containing protein [Acidobacteriota bacterium]
MKRLADLTVEDLTSVPVWRYEGGSDAEALVVPVRRDSLSQNDDDVFLAATEFELVDSARHFGFCFPADDSSIDYLQPVIVTGGRHVGFWFDAPVTPEVLADQWSLLGKAAENVFPVRFKCLVPVDGRTVSGEIPRVEFSTGLAAAGPVAVPPLATSERPPAPGSRSDAEHERKARPSTRWPGAERMLTARPVPARRRNAERVEKRTARRRPVEMAVDFSQESFHGSGVTGDVSRRGMFVRSNRIPGSGPLLRLTVHLPEGRKLFLTGRVVRSAESSGIPRPTGTTGFGLRFADESPEYENLLDWLSDESK